MEVVLSSLLGYGSELLGMVASGDSPAALSAAATVAFGATCCFSYLVLKLSKALFVLSALATIILCVSQVSPEMFRGTPIGLSTPANEDSVSDEITSQTGPSFKKAKSQIAHMILSQLVQDAE